MRWLLAGSLLAAAPAALWLVPAPAGACSYSCPGVMWRVDLVSVEPLDGSDTDAELPEWAESGVLNPWGQLELDDGVRLQLEAP